jgi:hypothetical protein
MVRFLDWATGAWAAATGGGVERIAGVPLDVPARAERVRLPSGEEVPVDGSRTVRATGRSGFYTFLAGDSVVDVEAVNPPVAESDPAALARREMEARIGAEVTEVRRGAAWDGAIFRARQGPELWWPLLLAALLLLVAEGALAAAGRARSSAGSVGGGGAARGAA